MALKKNTKKFVTNYYCLCSESSYLDILNKQKACPLSFTEFLEEYTECTRGCGSCIDNLKKYLSDTGNYIN